MRTQHDISSLTELSVGKEELDITGPVSVKEIGKQQNKSDSLPLSTFPRNDRHRDALNRVNEWMRSEMRNDYFYREISTTPSTGNSDLSSEDYMERMMSHENSSKSLQNPSMVFPFPSTHHINVMLEHCYRAKENIESVIQLCQDTMDSSKK